MKTIKLANACPVIFGKSLFALVCSELVINLFPTQSSADLAKKCDRCSVRVGKIEKDRIFHLQSEIASDRVAKP